MRILVTGPESSGTKLTAQLLKAAGSEAVEVVHYTPRPRRGDKFASGLDFDWVVLVVRDTYSCARSMFQNYHAENPLQGEWMILEALYGILKHLAGHRRVHIITYSSIIHKPGAIKALCRRLGLAEDFEMPQIGDGDAKYYGGVSFSDTTPLHDRGDIQQGEYAS